MSSDCCCYKTVVNKNQDSKKLNRGGKNHGILHKC